MKAPPSCPILSCDAARALEAGLFAGDEAKEWADMQRAGIAVASAVESDAKEVGGLPPAARLLVLTGKGHNGGDALIAAATLLRRRPDATADVHFVFGERALRPLAAKAWRDLAQSGAGRVRTIASRELAGRYDLCLDGVFGFQFRPPADAAVTRLIESVNALPIRLRAAVDLPSAALFAADFTYATGSVKAPVLESPCAGRIRYLDLGFFAGNEPGGARVLTPNTLESLRSYRAPGTDKRTFGHVLVLGGSTSFPGAILMTVLSALRSGAGLVTAFVPESIAPAFAARAPEAMWVGWPTTPGGGLALEGEHLLRARFERGTALVLGPGMGREPETMALAGSVVESSPLPVVIDADALQPEIVTRGSAPRIVTPHAGEYARIREATAREPKVTVVLKGPVTRIWNAGVAETPAGKRGAGDSSAIVYHSFFGGPVLARGGSGDLLAGLIAGQLAQSPTEPLVSAARGVVWHGLAADQLARAHGQVAGSVPPGRDFLPAALREM